MSKELQDLIDMISNYHANGSPPTDGKSYFLWLMKKFATYTGNDFILSVLDIEKVYDEIDIGNGIKKKIYPKDVPNILEIAKSTSNGIAGGFRQLNALGLRYKKHKDDKKIQFFGIGDKKTVAMSIPKSVLKHFDELVESGLTCCGQGCNTILTSGSFNTNRNWETDHIHKTSAEKYESETFRKDIANYQALCRSCNSKKRELEKPPSVVDSKSLPDALDNAASDD